jgi:filamentous hemagglutinin family protein
MLGCSGRDASAPATPARSVALGVVRVAAGPNGPSVVSGSATIQGQGGPAVIVNQSSSSAIINWNTFNIGANESVRFNQPSSSSVALNRVTGGLGPSEILGSLTANGRIFLINRDGILFGPGAVVNTAGFLATTHDIKNSDFMAGRYNFNIPGRPDASIVNQGRITATTGGFAALVAPGGRLFELRPGKPRSLGHGSFRHNLGHGACERISDAYRGSSSGFPATGLSGSRKTPRARAAFRPW